MNTTPSSQAAPVPRPAITFLMLTLDDAAPPGRPLREPPGRQGDSVADGSATAPTRPGSTNASDTEGSGRPTRSLERVFVGGRVRVLVEPGRHLRLDPGGRKPTIAHDVGWRRTAR
jgi:hypothetical protein